MTYTPGPYIEHGNGIYAATPQDVDHRHYRGFDKIEPGAPGYLIAESIPHGPTRKLLAAAPELFSTLENMVSWYGKRGGDDDALLPLDQQPKEIWDALLALGKASS